MKPQDLDRLIDDCLEGSLSEADAARLSAQLAESPETRARYWAAAAVHGLLENALQESSLRVVTGQAASGLNRRAGGWFPWKPWSAAAAGLVFGVLGASALWAYATPLTKRPVERMEPILTEGFEQAEMTPRRRFPRQANEWSGDLSAPVTAEAGVEPIEGQRMVRLAPSNTRRFGYAWRMIDLAEQPKPAGGETRRLEVTATFNAPGPARPLRYQVRLAAFSQEPAAIHEIWNDEPTLFNSVLQHVGRNVLAEADEPGWQIVRASMEVPPGTRILVISLAAGEGDPSMPPESYYLDNVQARFAMVPTSAD